jgi:sigma-B regulation protein RsbU (phosphoserine phosphatase)
MGLGLRAKSALALCVCTAVVLVLAGVAGWRVLMAIEESLGTAFARNVTRYNKQRILTPVLRELALSQRLADSEVTRRWLLDEDNPAKKALFFAEAERYRRAFADGSYFVISNASRRYYFNDRKNARSDKPRYSLRPGVPHDAWFFATMRNTRDFNINVDPDVKLKLTKVWFNVVAKDGARNIGLAGTGLDLSTFLSRFITSAEKGVTPMILNRAGDIQAHPNRSLIDYSSVNDKGARHSRVFRLLPRPADQAAMRRALEQAAQSPSDIPVFWAHMGGRPQLMALSSVPELGWYVLTVVDLSAATVIDHGLWLEPLAGAGALLLLLAGAVLLATERILLSPLIKLTHSARAMAAGRYDVALPRAGSDELGELTRAFGAMADQVRSHTDELEERVRERTRELVAVNEQVTQANKQIGDSIQYASLIQNAILPNQELSRALEGQYFVLWRPRDVVGGDFYVFRAHEHGCLLGVVDCAGHGVPGAFMTMIAHSAINVAIDSLGLHDPAALLAHLDEQVRARLPADSNSSLVATNMDAGLAYVDFRARTVTFSGAKISLYWCDAQEVGEVRGDRCAVGGKRLPAFSNRTVSLGAEKTFYLTTDGLLDQAGGSKGYSLGHERFSQMLLRHARAPLSRQKEVMVEELASYQGAFPQRDDITLLSFRFAPEATSGAAPGLSPDAAVPETAAGSPSAPTFPYA